LFLKNISLQHKVTTKITNKLHPKELCFIQLSVHCKDKLHDRVPDTLKYLCFNDLVLMSLLWAGGDHHFDIYVQEMDYYCHHSLCY